MRTAPLLQLPGDCSRDQLVIVIIIVLSVASVAIRANLEVLRDEDEQEDGLYGHEKGRDLHRQLRVIGSRQHVASGREQAKEAVDDEVLANHHDRQQRDQRELHDRLVLIDEALLQTRAKHERAVKCVQSQEHFKDIQGRENHVRCFTRTIVCEVESVQEELQQSLGQCHTSKECERAHCRLPEFISRVNGMKGLVARTAEAPADFADFKDFCVQDLLLVIGWVAAHAVGVWLLEL